MSLYNDDEIRQTIKELRTPCWGHGAFGEMERYDPSMRDLRMAQMLEDLLNDRNTR